MKKRDILLIGYLAIILIVFAFSFVSVGATEKSYVWYPDTQTATIKLNDVPVANLTLIENTERCGTHCSAIVNITPFYKFKLPDSYNETFMFNFEDRFDNDASGDLVDFRVSMYNGTIDLSSNGSRIVDTWKHEGWKNTWLQADTPYTFKLEGWRKGGHFNNNNRDIDWLPVLLGSEIKEMAWWTLSDIQFRYGLNETPVGNTTVQDDTGNYDATVAAGFTRLTGLSGDANDYGINATTGGYWDTTFLEMSYSTTSMSVWVNGTAAAAGTGVIISSGGGMGSGGGWFYTFRLNNSADVIMHGLAGAELEYNVFPNALDGSWHLLTATLDGSNNMKFYLDDVNTFNLSNPSFGLPIKKNAYVLLDGTGDWGSANVEIDEPTYWDVELNYTDVALLYSMGAADTDSPLITINHPTNITNKSGVNMQFNISANEALTGCNLSVNNGSSWVEMTLSGTSTEANYTQLTMSDNQNYTATFNCSDTSGNLNDTEQVTFSIDLTAPVISYSFTDGVNWEFLTSDIEKILQFRVNITEKNFALSNWTFYKPDMSISNQSGANVGGNITFTLNVSLTELGTYTLNVTANDTIGHNVTETTTFILSATSGRLGGGGGGGVGADVEEIEDEYDRCLNFYESFIESWQMAQDIEDWYERISTFWSAFWQFILCESSASIVPLDG